MEDKLTIFMALLSIIPLVVIIAGVWRETVHIWDVRRQVAAIKLTKKEKQTEYDRIVAATNEMEMDFQPNTGIHHSEQIYLNRSQMIREQTGWYKLINSL